MSRQIPQLRTRLIPGPGYAADPSAGVPSRRPRGGCDAPDPTRGSARGHQRDDTGSPNPRRRGAHGVRRRARLGTGGRPVRTHRGMRRYRRPLHRRTRGHGRIDRLPSAREPGISGKAGRASGGSALSHGDASGLAARGAGKPESLTFRRPFKCRGSHRGAALARRPGGARCAGPCRLDPATPWCRAWPLPSDSRAGSRTRWARVPCPR
jgi:hypothetical protein